MSHTLKISIKTGGDGTTIGSTNKFIKDVIDFLTQPKFILSKINIIIEIMEELSSLDS